MLTLEEGVTCRPRWTSAPWSLSYIVDNATGNHFCIALDFDGSSNIALSRSPCLELQLELGPYDRVRVDVRRVDEQARCAIKLRHAISKLEASDKRHAVKEQEDKALAALLMNVYAASPVDASQRQGLPYVDATFMPSEASVGSGGRAFTWKHVSQLYGPLTPFTDRDCDRIQCLSPEAPLTSTGLASALAILSERQSILLRAMSTRDGDDRFSVQLYRHGEPVLVEVDGFVPCVPGGGPAILKCTHNALWPLVLQKALAKFFSSFSALQAASTSSVLEVVCGHPRLALSHEALCNTTTLDTLRRVQAAMTKQHLVCASVASVDAAIVSVELSSVNDHSSSITLRDTSHLLDSVFPGGLRHAATLRVQFNAFAARAPTLWYIPHVPESGTVLRRRFFIPSKTAPAASEAVFALSVVVPVTAVIALQCLEPPTDTIGIAVLEVQDNGRIHEVASTSATLDHSSCSVHTTHTIIAQFSPGEYLIAIKPWSRRQEAQRDTVSKLEGEAALRSFFRILDTDMDDRLGIDDLRRFLHVYEDGLTLSEAAFTSIVNEFESDARGLTFQGLCECYESYGIGAADCSHAIFQTSAQCILSLYLSCPAQNATLLQIE